MLARSVAVAALLVLPMSHCGGGGTPTPTTTTTSTLSPVTLPPDTTVPATTVPPTTQPPSQGVQFVETFDTPESLDRFDFAVHHAWTANPTKTSWQADHDLQCGGADTSRTIQNPTAIDGRTYYPGLREPTSYWCREHLMTTFNTSHYAQVDFAPKATFTDVRSVCWTQSRNLLGSRHWTQLAVVPAATFNRNGGRLDYVASRFSPSGPGKYGIHPTDSTLLVEFGLGKPRVQIGQSVQDDDRRAWNAGSDRSSRYRHCVIDTGSGLQIQIAIANDRDGNPVQFETYTYSGGIPDGPVRVVLQQDLYNPDKADNATGAYTVHWDSIVVE